MILIVNNKLNSPCCGEATIIMWIFLLGGLDEIDTTDLIKEEATSLDFENGTYNPCFFFNKKLHSTICLGMIILKVTNLQENWGQLYKTLNYDLTSHRVVNT